MKHLVLRLVVLVGLASSAGPVSAQDTPYLRYASLPIDSLTRYVTYAGVATVTGVAQERVLARAQQWAIQFFLPNERAWQLADPTAGTYSCRGTVHLPYGTDYTMLLTVEAHDGSYRYRVNQLYYNYVASFSDPFSERRQEPVEHWATYKNRNLEYVDLRIREVQRFMPELLNSLHTYVNAEPQPGLPPAR